MTSSVTYVICEGYEDRAFWKGLLLHRRCKDARMNGGLAVDPRDQEPIVGGRHAYVTPTGRWIVVQSAEGRNNVRSAAESHVRRLDVRPLEQLIINVDSDADAADPENRSVDDFLDGLAASLGFEKKDLRRRWARKETPMLGIVWECPGTDQLTVPSKQTLERLVCAAIHRVAPDCTQSVRDWLDALPLTCAGQSSNRLHKRQLWTHYGKWFVDCGPEHLLARVWELPEIRDELASILKETGVWAAIDEITR
jgi:hypothetical protein